MTSHEMAERFRSAFGEGVIEVKKERGMNRFVALTAFD